MSYRKETIKGFSWTIVLRIATRASAFFKTLLLAKILSPSQYGTYGVALIVLGLLEVATETGVNVLLIQEEKTDDYINSAWVVSIIRGVFICLLIIVSAPFIANFFNAPNVKILLYLISIAPLLRGFINPSVVKFQKELTFHKEFWYKSAILLVDSFVSVVTTVVMHSPVGIAIGLLIGVVLEVALSHVIVKPRPILQFNKNYINKVFHRGKWLTISSFCNYLFYNADNIVVGKLLGTTALGTYQIAYALAILPVTEIADSLTKVTFPIFTKISKDIDRLKKAFFTMIVVLVVLMLPIGLLLYFYPQMIITFILGNKWMLIVSVLPTLAVFGTIKAFSNYSTTLFLSIGKQEYVSLITFVSIVGLILPIIPFVHFFGLVGAARAVLFGSIITLPIIFYYIWQIFYKQRV